MSRPPVTSVKRLARRSGGMNSAARAVPEEVPVALSYGGTTHAVMMATPADLEDFALGFSLTEGIVGSAGEIAGIDIEEAGAGVDIQIRLKDAADDRFQARRRHLAGPVGCGLCGSNAHAATLCPSFYRAEVVANPAWHERLLAGVRAAVTGWLRPASA